MPAGLGGNDEVVLPCHPDAAHGGKEPLYNGALGIVVETGNAAVLGVGALPGLPDGGGAGLGHAEPAGDLLVFQQSVGVLDIQLRQHVEDQRGGEKARAQPPAVAVQGRQQALFGIFGLRFVQQLHVKRPHQLGLAVGIQAEFLRAHQSLVAPPGLLGGFVIQRGVGWLIQHVGDFFHVPHQIDHIGRALLRVRRDEIRHGKGLHVGGLGPFPVGLAVVGDVFPVRQADSGGLCGGVPLAEGSPLVQGVAAHALIGFFEDPTVAVLAVDDPGDQHARIGPARRAVHGVHIGVHPALWRDLGIAAGFVLDIPQIVFVFPGKGGEAEEIARGSGKDLGVAGPTVALPGGAVGGDVQVVVFGRPDRGLEEAV